MNLNGTEYFYLRNLQNDIFGIVDDSGTFVVEYQYDTFGKLLNITGPLASTVGVKNPYRYRGYRYDTETGLYYLNSRYYNPEIGRFINADDTSVLQWTQGMLLSHNLFAYCGNNPVMGYDPSGFLYLSNSSINSFIIFARVFNWSIRWCNGYAMLAPLIAPYIAIFFSWINAVPGIGQVIFFIIIVAVAYVAYYIAVAKFSGRGVDFSFWYGWPYMRVC